MSTIEAALATRLLADSTVGPLVGGVRIWPNKAKQRTNDPYLIYQRVSGKRLITLDGPLPTQAPRIQYAAWAKDYGDTKALIEATIACLHGFRGTLGSFNVLGIFVQEDEKDDVQAPTHADDVSDQDSQADFIVWFEPIPG